LKCFEKSLVQLICKNNAHCLQEAIKTVENDDELKYLPLCQNLKKFVATGVTRSTLAYLNRLEKLVCLKLQSNSVDADSCDWFFKNSQLKNLKILDLRECQLDDKSLKSIASKYKFFVY
jgi:hypothetical protein